MTPSYLRQAKETYSSGLLGDVLPFWIEHGVDHEHGGVITSLDRDGTTLDTDKAIWPQGRFAWLLATLYNTVEKREEWLSLARQTLSFIRRHGFDADGRMFFLVTRDGRPLRKRRYMYAEAFISSWPLRPTPVRPKTTRPPPRPATFFSFSCALPPHLVCSNRKFFRKHGRAKASACP